MQTFKISKNFYEIAKVHVKQQLMGNEDENKLALIVAPFQTERSSYPFPKSKGQLVRDWDQGLLLPCRLNYFWPGHGPTDFPKWRDAKTPYQITYQKQYEPYVIVKRRENYFDPQFAGFGKDKALFIDDLNTEGYTFKVLPDLFIVHYPHPENPDKMIFKSDKTFKNCITSLYNDHVAKKQKK